MTGQRMTSLRSALLELCQGEWPSLWLVTPSLQAEALGPLLPRLRRQRAVRVLTDLSHGALLDQRVEPEALRQLRQLPDCEIRGLGDCSACVYAAEGGPALVSASPLTLQGLDSRWGYGVRLEASDGVLDDLREWWACAQQLSPVEWSRLEERANRWQEARRIGAELARLGAFVRVSVRGTRRSRRLDPREYGVPGIAGPGGGRLRPLEVLLYRLDDVIRAKDDLDRILAENGLEWNGQYLVPRRFLEQEWPAIFGARERQLRERLASPESRAALEAQLERARGQLQEFFGEIYPWIDSEGIKADLWVGAQTARILQEAVVESVLAEGGLEYRVLSISPEDPRSQEELALLLQDPKLRSVQLTFPF